MRFLANENFPRAAVGVLAAAGHDIVWVRTAAPDASDPDVLAWAVREQRILLTFDKDFGELANGAALPSGCGVVLFRIPVQRRGDVGRFLANLIAERDDWPVISPLSRPVAFECVASDSADKCFSATACGVLGGAAQRLVGRQFDELGAGSGDFHGVLRAA